MHKSISLFLVADAVVPTKCI